MKRSSKKQTQSLNQSELGIATRVEREINIFFSEDKTRCKNIIVDDFHNNIDNIKNYINYLNYNIQNDIQILTDINYSNNGKIIEVLNNDEITSDIKIKYEKHPDKYYPANLQSFIKYIYICDDNIFFLMPFKFRKENTPNFNKIQKEYININDLLSLKKQKTLRTPREQICKKDLFKERYNINKDNNSLYKLKYNDNDLFKYVFFINMLKEEIKSNNIDLIDCYYEKFGKIHDIKLESKKIKIQYFKDSNVNYYDIPLDMFINNIYIENSNKIYYLIENSVISDSIKIISLIDYIYAYINLYEYIKEIFKNFNNEYYLKMFISNESYLNNIFSTSLSNIQTVFENTFIYLNNNIEEAIYIYCNKITDNKEEALQTILELINNYLFYIYQYYIVIEHYKKFLQSDDFANKNIENFYVYMKTSNFNTYLEYIIYQFNIDINIFKKSITGQKLTVYKLNNTVLRNITPFKYPDNKLDIINNKSLLIDYIRSTKSSINYLNIISSDDYNENNVITIPQYTNICWFIAMITGITYSDYSRKLLYSNRLRSSNKFIRFIYYIIDNITIDKKAYSINLNKIDMSNCDLLKYLKEAPINVLKDYIVNYALINKLHEDPHKQDIKNMFIKILQDNRNESITLTSNIIYKYIQNNLDTVKYLILYNILQDKTYELNTDNIDTAVNDIWCDFIKNISININSFTNYSIPQYNTNILENFYNLLNIKSLFLYINKTARNIKLYTKSLNPIDEYKSYEPDIIILNTGYNTEVLSELTDHDITFDNNYKTIIFNGFKYKLDYMLHSTDVSKTCINCGHCICALEYYGVQYIHDSRNTRYLLKCNDHIDYRIPCSLIKNNWKDNIFTDKCYTINTCGYLNKDGLNSSTILQNISSTHLCYGYDNRYTFVYVKITSSLASVSNNRSRSRSSRSRSY